MDVVVESGWIVGNRSRQACDQWVSASARRA